MRTISQKKLLKSVAKAAIYLALILAVFGSLANANVIRTGIGKKLDTELAYVPAPNTVRLLSLGYENAAADVIWLRTVQYIGSNVTTGTHQFPKLGDLLRVVTELDPYFQFAYETALVLLPDSEQLDTALALGIQGVDMLPDDPELPYYLAYDYFQYAQNYQAAADWFDYASTRPNALPSARTLAAVNLSKAGVFDVPLVVWQNVYDTTTDEVTKSNAAFHISRLRNLSFLDTAIQQYIAQFGQIPPTLEALVAAGIIPGLPRDLDARTQYFINQETSRPDIQRKS